MNTTPGHGTTFFSKVLQNSGTSNIIMETGEKNIEKIPCHDLLFWFRYGQNDPKTTVKMGKKNK